MSFTDGRFRIEPYPPERYAKHFTITDTKTDFSADVDYDDVNPTEVLAVAQEVVNVLNHHFTLKEG